MAKMAILAKMAQNGQNDPFSAKMAKMTHFGPFQGSPKKVGLILGPGWEGAKMAKMATFGPLLGHFGHFWPPGAHILILNLHKWRPSGRGRKGPFWDPFWAILATFGLLGPISSY